MRFRLGLFSGMAIGYVLGAKAGRQRYEQIVAASRKVARSEPAQHLSAEVQRAASRAGEKIEAKAAEGVNKVTSMVRRGERDTPNGEQQPHIPPS